MQQHPEERDSLALLSSLFVPTFSNNMNHDYVVDWARSLLQRGADVNAREEGGFTPVQSWCSRDDITSAKGILELLNAGADLDATQPDGFTALYLLCSNSRLQALRELSDAGWLEMANIDLPGRNGETPMACLQRKLREKPGDAVAKEMIELLSAQKDHWSLFVRPAILAQLGVHEQLIPELAELIVSFIDGGKPTAAAGSNAAAASN